VLSITAETKIAVPDGTALGFKPPAFKNPSSQAYAHVFSANFAADCVKNPCRAKARLRIFAYSASKLCSKIRTHFL